MSNNRIDGGPPTRRGRAVAVFSKIPQPGRSKTRLSRALSPQAAALLHRACLLDLSRLLAGYEADAYLYWTGGTKEEFLAPLAGTVPPGFSGLGQLSLTPSFAWRPQKGADLGARMAGALDELLARHQKVLLVGSDLPELTREHLNQAFALLDNKDLVVGPAADGGYYLIGLKESRPELFTDMPWGTGLVGRLTLDRARQEGLTAATLPVQRDLDTYGDLLALGQRAPRPDHEGPIFWRLARYYLQLEGRASL